jgi:hypothetical protein
MAGLLAGWISLMSSFLLFTKYYWKVDRADAVADVYYQVTFSFL